MGNRCTKDDARIDNVVPDFRLNNNRCLNDLSSLGDRPHPTCLHCNEKYRPGSNFCPHCSLCIEHLDKGCHACAKTPNWLDLAIPQRSWKCRRTDPCAENRNILDVYTIDVPRHHVFATTCPGCNYMEFCLKWEYDLPFENYGINRVTIDRVMTGAEYYHGDQQLSSRKVHLSNSKHDV